MRSVPQDVPPRTPLFSIPGTPPSLDQLPDGCAFAPRCTFASDRCRAARPDLIDLSNQNARQVACFHPVATDAVHSTDVQDKEGAA